MNNIILQNYNELLKKVIKDAFDSNLSKHLRKLDNNNVMNYIGLLSNLDESLCSIALESLKTTLETLDRSFKNTTERKSKYYIKSYHERSILTVFGQLSYKRHFYTSKLNHKNYCYVDRLLGLHKYDYFDPYIKALIIDYSADNSMPKTAKYINDLIGNRISTIDKFKFISRQTVRNVILSAKLSNVTPELKEDIDTLYIIADEKWIHTQNNEGKDVMQKSIVIFEGIKNNKLCNKMCFSSLDSSFLHNSLDYIYSSYNVDNINTIFLMGDGARWIKSLRTEFKFHKNLDVVYGLDKFHFKQALHHLCLNKHLESILEDYVLHNMKKEFNHVVTCLIKINPHREVSIKEKHQYIINNWLYINNLYKFNLSCPMESQISHNIAALFTSRPKGFSKRMINKLTKLRMLYKNNFNIKKLFLNNFNSNDIFTINKGELDFSFFKAKQFEFDYNKYIPISNNDNITYDNSFNYNDFQLLN